MKVKINIVIEDNGEYNEESTKDKIVENYKDFFDNILSPTEGIDNYEINAEIIE